MFLLIALTAVIVIGLLLVPLVRRMEIAGGGNPLVMAASVLFLAGGMLLTHSTISSLNYMEAYRNWQTVKGRVVEAEIAGKRAFHPKVKYTFHWQDSSYSNISDLDAPGFGTKAARFQVAREMLKNIHVGDSIDVWVNPQNPAENTLVNHPRWNSFMQYGAGIFFSAAALAFLISSLFQRLTLNKETRKP